MREIGARELKATLSQTLRTVARGERVGPPDDQHLRELVASGRPTPAARAKPEREPRLIKGRGSASALVLEERDAGR